METKPRQEGSPLHVVAGVIVRGDELLLAQRLPGGAHGGLWEFPGGKVEPGESEQQALERELEEELGVVVNVGRPCLEVTHPYPHRSIRLCAYWCRTMNDAPRPVGCAALEWIKHGKLLENLYRYPMPEADIAIAHHVAEYLSR